MYHMKAENVYIDTRVYQFNYRKKEKESHGNGRPAPSQGLEVKVYRANNIDMYSPKYNLIRANGIQRLHRGV